jgi:branched-chain amino acid aminotransferase
MMTHAWVDGRLVDAAAPALAVTETGFTVGDGVFTTTVVSNGVPFALARNLARLGRHCERVGFEVPDLERLRVGAFELLDADGVRSGRLRLTVTGGVQVITIGPPSAYGPVSVSVTLPWRRNERGPLAGVKSTSFGENLVAQRYFRPLGADEGLLANTADEVCEGVTSNVFVVLDGVLHTPTLASGCLDGVTREILCELLPVDETALPLAVLDSCGEAFWTSATRKVQPIASLDGRTLRTDGAVTRRASQALAGWRE